MDVVIVDDTQINVLLMQALVGKLEGCKPISFTDSGAGLQYCLDNEPDLVIVDYQMPAPDGIEFIQRFRESNGKADTPVLMVTAAHEKEVRYRALESGATDFLTKPVDRMEFLSRARNMLALRRSHLALADRAATLSVEVRKATEVIVARERETILRLARAAEFRDPETGAHILRMANYSSLIAQKMGMDEEFQDLLLQAAPMHDVGKLGTPDHILLKPGKLTPEEFEIMKQHATIGYEILKDSASEVLQLAAKIALSHHEKFDGSGYPGGSVGQDIPIEGRIVAVADVFDALTSERPYKKAWELPRAIAMLEEGAGKHFDPDCVRAFLSDMDGVLEIKNRYRDDD
ncbi:MAG: HD domain-containing protein [Rhodocyclaceae bacterium]|nr:HD domain-containing protein [Rhodocyclaceae bacterium]